MPSIPKCQLKTLTNKLNIETYKMIEFNPPNKNDCIEAQVIQCWHFIISSPRIKGSFLSPPERRKPAVPSWPGLFAVYRGWDPIQLYRDFNKPFFLDPYEPISNHNEFYYPVKGLFITNSRDRLLTYQYNGMSQGFSSWWLNQPI